ncbi:MAG: hypothetical protein WA728_02630 [Xanthobacteraceae bacterium]
MDYKFFAELRKEQEARTQEQRREVMTKLLNEANKQSENTNAEEQRVKEVAPAK